jgi:hypothetical protein
MPKGIIKTPSDEKKWEKAKEIAAEHNPHFLNKRFGLLTCTGKYEIRTIGTDNKKNRFYEARCDCGSVVFRTSTSLKNKFTSSCGCVRPGARKKRGQRLEKGIAASRALFNNRKNQAKYRNLLWQIDFDLFINLSLSSCHYCGREPSYATNFGTKSMSKYNGQFIYNGIDRVDSSIGYVVDNIVTCCGICNRMKMNSSYSDFINHVSRIYNHIKLLNNGGQ